MSVKNRSPRCVLGMLLIANCGLPSTVLAFDPLRTERENFSPIASLSGDKSPPPCGVVKDFNTLLLMNEAVDLALCNNKQVAEAWVDIKIQSNLLGEARAAYLPSLSTTISRVNDKTRYSQADYPTSDNKSSTEYAALTWRLLDFGTRSANDRSAERLLDAALASRDATIQSTLQSVIQSYYDVLTAQSYYLSKKENEDIAQRTLQSTQRQEEKGITSHSDTLQAMTALAKITLDKNRANSSYLKAMSALDYAMGVPSVTRPILPEQNDDKPAEALASLDSWLAEAEKAHPAIVAARAQLAAAKERALATRSNDLPTLDFSANYYRNGRPGQSVSPSTRETTVALVLTIPIFDGFGRNYRIQGAEAQVDRKEEELEDIEGATLRDVVNAYVDYNSALENLSGSEALMSDATDSLTVSERRYEKGAGSIIELLNAQSAMSDAQAERIRCLAEWRSARLRLLTSVGNLDRASLQN